MTELGCLAHARRKFFDLHAASGSLIALEALNRIAALYAIEARGKSMDVAARAELRQDEAQPLLQSLHDWLLKTRVTVANGGGTAKAMDYSLRRWAALSLYTTDGRLPIDNNPVENVIRPIAIGKKIGYLLDRNVQGNGRRRFRVCWRPRSSTGLILPPGCVKRWRGCRLASTVRSIRCCRSARNQSNKCRGAR